MQPLVPITGGKILSNDQLKGAVEFRNVTFSYPTRSEDTVLDSLTLNIPAGKIMAICGPSGEGKSTLACLLERFYDVDSGNILIDGCRMQDLNPSWLRGKVLGFISQEPVLFATSILENIRYGRLDATEEEVMEAAKIAKADEFIKQFPDGYHTLVGERGVTISGGQKQRIAIARALIKNPTILILDEATSALDSKSEKEVQDAIDEVVHGRTVLVIAHRLSTIQNADTIVVLRNGKVAEVGTHQSLKNKKGLYWTLIEQQQKNSDENKQKLEL